jgi:hypothetical protein
MNITAKEVLKKLMEKEPKKNTKRRIKGGGGQ